MKKWLRVCATIGISMGVWGVLGAGKTMAHGGGHSGGGSHSSHHSSGHSNQSFNRGHSNHQIWWLLYQQQLQQQQNQKKKIVVPVVPFVPLNVRH